MNRLRQAVEAIGPAGAIGVGILAFCAVFYFSAYVPLQRELTAQRSAAEKLKVRSPVQIVSGGGRAQELRRFYSLFPAVSHLPDELERVYALARNAKLSVDRGEYRLEQRGSGLLSYRVTLPVRGTYPEVREFLGSLLRDVPTAAIEALRFERKKVGDAELEGQVRLTLYFRSEGEEAFHTAAEAEGAR